MSVVFHDDDTPEWVEQQEREEGVVPADTRAEFPGSAAPCRPGLLLPPPHDSQPGE